MKKSISFLFFFIVLISACSPPPATATPLPTIANTPTSEPPPELPFSQPGNYLVGVRRGIEFVDESRGGRKVGLVIWYPAAPGQGDPGKEIKNAIPDLSAAPYPMILSSSKLGFVLAPYLVSYGFTYVGVTRIDAYWQMTTQMYDQPLDLLFALDMIAKQPPPELEGVLDTDHVGVTGYSFDGYNTLALSGARIDPLYYLGQCPNPDDTTKSILLELSAFNCSPADAWEEFEAGLDETITASEDGMWQAMTDERIRAVLPMAGEGWWLFGERGLAAVNRPVLMIVATEDELYPENALIFEHLGTPDKTLISFVGLNHMMIYDIEPSARMANFAVAFFGYYLQGKQEYQAYFSRDFITKYPDLAWGVYQK